VIVRRLPAGFEDPRLKPFWQNLDLQILGGLEVGNRIVENA